MHTISNRKGISTALTVVIVVVVLIVGVAASYFVFSGQPQTSGPTQTVTTTQAVTTTHALTTTQAITTTATQATSSTSSGLKPYKIVMFDVVVASDPWSIALKNGLDAAVKALNGTNGYSLSVTYVYGVGDSDIQADLQSYASQGYNLLIPTDATYVSAIDTVAPSFPKTQFLGCCMTDTQLGPNIGSFEWGIWRGYYAAGVVAGAMTTTNKIGFVTAFSFDNANEAIDAYLAGAQLVNPNVKIVYTFTSSWSDSSKAQAGAQSLASLGADVIAGMGGGLTDGVVQGAASSNVYAIAYLHDGTTVSPTNCLTTVTWNTTGYFLEGIQAAETAQLGFKSYAISVYPAHISGVLPLTNVPQNKLAIINPYLQKIANGTLVEPVNTTLPTQG